MFRDDVKNVIPLSNVVGVRYFDNRRFEQRTKGHLYITIQGQNEQKIADGDPKTTRLMAEAISKGAGVHLTD